MKYREVQNVSLFFPDHGGHRQLAPNRDRPLQALRGLALGHLRVRHGALAQEGHPRHLRGPAKPGDHGQLHVELHPDEHLRQKRRPMVLAEAEVRPASQGRLEHATHGLQRQSTSQASRYRSGRKANFTLVFKNRLILVSS